MIKYQIWKIKKNWNFKIKKNKKIVRSDNLKKSKKIIS